MREIKFRAWSKKHKLFVGDGPMDLNYSAKYNAFMFDNDAVDLDEDVVFQQFTGLKDKNGREIYEGDILKFTDGTDVSHHEIFWDDRGARWFDKRLEDGDSQTAYEDFEFVKDCKVVGNIYEIPVVYLTNSNITSVDATLIKNERKT